MSMQQSINKATWNFMLLFPGDKQDSWHRNTGSKIKTKIISSPLDMET